MRAYLILSDVTVLGLTPRVNQYFARGYICVGGPFVDTARLLYQAIHSKTAVT